MRSIPIKSCAIVFMALGTYSCSTERRREVEPLCESQEIARTQLDEAMQDDDKLHAAKVVTRVARRCPVILNALDARTVQWAAYRAHNDSAVYGEALRSLFEAEWALDSEIESSDLWYDLALQEVTEGNLAQARRVLNRITDPLLVIRIVSDRRFDHIVSPLDGQARVQHTVQRNLAIAKARVDAHPRSALAFVLLLEAYTMAGDYQEALRVSHAFTEGVSALDDANAQFDDAGTMYSWLLDARASAFEALGNDSAAEHMLVDAASVGQDGEVDVGNILNLASFYQRHGRNREALASLPSMEDVNEYGAMVRSYIEYRAATALGDIARAKDAFSYLQEHRRDGEDQYTHALLFRGDEEGAAAELKARLRDPGERSSALMFFQDLVLAGASGPDDPPVDLLEAKLKKRPDLIQAVNKVGRIGTFAVRATR